VLHVALGALLAFGCGSADERASGAGAELPPGLDAASPAAELDVTTATDLSIETDTAMDPVEVDGATPADDVFENDIELPDIADIVDVPSLSPKGCVKTIAAGQQKISCGSLMHDLHVPTACLTKSCGLVLDIHGLTMSGKQEDNNTQARALGELNGYIVLQPNANPAPPAASWVALVDDAQVLAMLDDVTAAYAIDPKRVHVMGFSQGGMMTWRLLCKHADRFASAAPGGSCEYVAMDGCSFKGSELPSRRIPIFYSHGTKDVFYPFSCAEKQRDAIIAGWKLGAPAVVSQGGAHLWTRYTGAGGAWLEFVQHDYKAASPLLGGHCYPGSSDAGKEPGQVSSYACKGPNDYAWGDAAMQFFIAHPMGN